MVTRLTEVTAWAGLTVYGYWCLTSLSTILQLYHVNREEAAENQPWASNW
jgi:hypothetical protein